MHGVAMMPATVAVLMMTAPVVSINPLPTIILVQPQMPENIGAVARAMKNCGFSALRLVKPREAWPHPQALAMAAGADDILHNAEVYSTLADAMADHTLVLATTARPRRIIKPVYSLEQVAPFTRDKTNTGNRVAFVFGAERMGLSNDDVALCDGIITIDLNPAYASLNIAQAVLLVAYQCWQVWRQLPTPTIEEPLATHGAIQHFMVQLEGALLESGFLRVPEKQAAMMRNIRAIVHRAQLRPHEVQTLHGILKSLRVPQT
jgi:tRNA/rRNA methyltransferase